MAFSKLGFVVVAGGEAIRNNPKSLFPAASRRENARGFIL
jgi:hypothetical protein